MDRPIQPNEKCPCKSGKKYKKCCMYKSEFGALAAEEKIPETPDEIAAFEADFARLLGWFVENSRTPDFVEFMHEEKDAVAWRVDGEDGLVLTPYPAHIQAMRERERLKAS